MCEHRKQVLFEFKTSGLCILVHRLTDIILKFRNKWTEKQMPVNSDSHATQSLQTNWMSEQMRCWAFGAQFHKMDLPPSVVLGQIWSRAAKTKLIYGKL